VSLGQLKVMSAIENCRTAAPAFIKNLGHVARCEDRAHEVIAYNSCRNRHCPKCQALAQARWVAARTARILPTHLMDDNYFCRPTTTTFAGRSPY
jgi:hypothetical protein